MPTNDKRLSSKQKKRSYINGDGALRIVITISVVFVAALLALTLLSYSGANIPLFTQALNSLTERNNAEKQDDVNVRAGAGAANSEDAVNPEGLLNWGAVGVRTPDLSLTYDPSEATTYRIYGDYIAECSRNSFYLLGGDGAEVFRKNVDFSRPAMNMHGEYLLVYDTDGRSAFLMKGVKTVWEDTFTSGISYASVNKNGFISFVLEAVGYRNSVRVFEPIGKARFDWVVADDYVISSEVAPSGRALVVNRMNTTGITASSGLEFLDMNSEPFLTIKSAGEDVFLSALYLDNNTLSVVTENTFGLYSEQGGQLIQKKFTAIMSMCEFPKNSATVAVRNNNRTRIVGYDSKTLQEGVFLDIDRRVRNMSADNGYLFINFGDGAVVLRDSGKLASQLVLESEALYGGASEKTGVLVVNGRSADLYAFSK